MGPYIYIYIFFFFLFLLPGVWVGFPKIRGTFQKLLGVIYGVYRGYLRAL